MNKLKQNYFSSFRNEDKFTRERNKTIQIFLVKKNIKRIIKPKLYEISDNEYENKSIGETILARNFKMLKDSKTLNQQFRLKSFICKTNESRNYVLHKKKYSEDYKENTNIKFNDRFSFKNLEYNNRERQFYKDEILEDRINIKNLYSCMTISNRCNNIKSASECESYKKKGICFYKQRTLYKKLFDKEYEVLNQQNPLPSALNKESQRKSYLNRIYKGDKDILYEIKVSRNFPRFDPSQIVNHITKRRKSNNNNKTSIFN